MARILRRAVPAIVLAAVAVSAASCVVPPAPLAGTNWTLQPGSLDVPIPGGSSITATFSATEISGVAACNSYRAQYTAGPGNKLDIGDIVTTRRACAEPILRAEQAFIAELRLVTTYEADGNFLRMGDGTNDLLRFRAADPTPGNLYGRWRVTRYMNAGDGLSTVLPGTTITLEFGRDNNVAGMACNSYAGLWSVNGDALTIGDLIATERACTSPPGVMQQESDYFTALRSARTWSVQGNQLTLAHPRGTAVIAERAGA
jgi:heat shock protein HslJ